MSYKTETDINKLRTYIKVLQEGNDLLRDELELYKKALDIICFDYVNAFWGTRTQKQIEKRFLDKAQKEIESEKQ